MSQRANLIKCEGLVTYGSELSAREGSLRQATNVNIDEDGVITPRRGFATYGNSTTTNIESARVKQLFEYKDRLFRHFKNQLQFEDDTGSFVDILGEYNEVRDGYRIKWKESKGNMYFTTDDGVKRISLKSNKDLKSSSTINVEQAGIPKAAYMEGDGVDAIDGFLKPQSKVAYRFIFGLKDSNNNLLLGSPSARHIVSNTYDRSVIYEQYSFSISQNFDLNQDSYYISDGDYIVINSLNSKTTFFFKTTYNTVKFPQNSQTIGSTFVEVDITSTRNQPSAPEYDGALLYKTGNKVLKNLKVYECKQNLTDKTDPDQIPGATSSIDYWEELTIATSDLISGSAFDNNVEVTGILSSIMSEKLPQFEVTTTGGSDILLKSKEEGDIEDPYIRNIVIGSSASGSVSYVKIDDKDGEVIPGENKNCDLTLVIPNTVTPRHFVQLYRTSIITKPDGIELNLYELNVPPTYNSLL